MATGAARGAGAAWGAGHCPPGPAASRTVAAGEDGVDFELESKCLVDGGGQDWAVPAVLKGADQPRGGEEHLEDPIGNGPGLGVGAHQRPGGAA
ncbi:hypothetical protein [Actinomyces oricola]